MRVTYTGAPRDSSRLNYMKKKKEIGGTLQLLHWPQTQAAAAATLRSAVRVLEFASRPEFIDPQAAATRIIISNI